MKPSAQSLRGREAPGSARRASPARLFHTLFAYCATSLILVLIVYTFFLILLLRTLSPGRHVTFVDDSEPSTSRGNTSARRSAPPPPPPRLPEKGKNAPPPIPARTARPPSLSLTVTPRELEPPTPDVAEDPMRALARICAFLVSNTARAAQRAELGATPPLAGLEPYLGAVNVDLAYIEGMRAEAEEGRPTDDGVAEDIGASASEGVDSGACAGAGVSVDAHAHDELALVQPQQATNANAPPLPPPSQSQSPTPTPHPAPPPPPPIITQNLPPSTSTSKAPKPKPSLSTDSTMTVNNPRRRKDAVLRPSRARADSGVLVDADADDAAVRAAALLARFADIGAELEGTVRERGAALWAALSRRTAPLDLPVPPLPRTPSSAALIAARGAPVVEASRAVAHQAAWRARFALYGKLFGPVAEQTT